MEEWIKKTDVGDIYRYKYNGILLGIKNTKLAFANMEGQLRIMLTKISQKEKDKSCKIHLSI